MGLNLTGAPSAADYVIGRGAIFVALLDANKAPKDWRHLGNTTALAVSNESETLDHFSSRSGIKQADLQLIVSNTCSISFSIDECNFDNLAMLLLGDAANASSAVPTSNASKLGMTDVQQVTSASKGRWVDLKDSAGRRLYDVKQANLTVKTESVGTPGTAGSTIPAGEYTLDTKMGRIFLSTAGSAHTNGKMVFASYTADATAANIDQVRGYTQTQVVVALKFIQQNPSNNNKQTEYQFHSVTLKPTGDFSLISDDYTEMSFEGVAGKNETFSPASPVVTITDFATS